MVKNRYPSPSEAAILPEPFEWVYIPAGNVTLKHSRFHNPDEHYPVSEFFIAKYPITNAQFDVFVKETAIHIKHSTRLQDGFDGANQPVLDILWLEAWLFCEWISRKLPYPQKTRTIHN
jgi:formylglycine-generating enzyme required for sulfatase activity